MTLEEAAVSLNMDLEAALDRVVNNRSLLIRLLVAIVQESCLEQIEEFYQKKEYGKMEDPVHSLKGAAASLSLYGLSVAANELLQMIRAKDEEAVPQYYEKMKQQYQKVRDVVQNYELV